MPRSAYASRACDACKRRKVKCDAAEPCANCCTSQIPCAYTIVPQKRGRNVRKRSLDSAASVARPVQAFAPNDAATITSSPASHPGGHLSSPRSVFSSNDGAPGLQISYAARDDGFDAMSIRENLVSYVNGQLNKDTIEDVANRCIELYMQYIFPHTPVGHEPTLRASSCVLRLGSSPIPVSATSHLAPQPARLALMKSFTMITALCALVTSVVPESLIAQHAMLTHPFLQASRAMLMNYEAHDLEHPDSTTLLIRAWHGSAMQNASGKPGAAAHCHMGSGLLALRLRLYDEASVTRPSTLESQLLRSMFWLLYLSDKASSVLETRVFILHEGAFDGDLTVAEYADPSDASQLDMTRAVNRAPLEARVQAAFHLKRRLWTAAADLLAGIKCLPHSSTVFSDDVRRSMAERPDLGHLTSLYQAFTGLVEDLPSWLRYPVRQFDVVEAQNAEAAKYEETCLVASRSNIMTSFHCIKLLILQKCIHHDARRVVGLGDSEVSWDLRKMEIVQDFLHELQTVPFLVFKMQGEPAVERTRRIGSILLELVENASNESIKAQAKCQFTQLLDYLAQLDSRASDQLGGYSMAS